MFDVDRYDAPIADAILHVLEMHDHVRCTADAAAPLDIDRTYGVVAALVSYVLAEPTPPRIRDAVDEVLTLVYNAAGARENAHAAADPREAQRFRDMANQADSEARHIIRHKITLEGNDL